MKSLSTGSIIGLSVLEIPFWMSKDPGLSLPLIAMQNQEIQLDVHFAGSSDGQWSKTSYKGTNTAGNYLAHNGTNSNLQNCFNAFATAKVSSTSDALLNPIRGDNSKVNFDIDISVLYI